MNSPRGSLPDIQRSRLRATIATIDQEIASLPKQDGTSLPTRLAASWADLVEQMALGPEPETRECPVCEHIGMRAATVCGYCWTALTPATGRDGVMP